MIMSEDLSNEHSVCAHGNRAITAGDKRPPALSLSDEQIRRADALLTRRERELIRLPGTRGSGVDICPLSIYIELGYVRPEDVRFDPAYERKYRRWMDAHEKAYGPVKPRKKAVQEPRQYTPTPEDLRYLAGDF